MIVSTNLSSWVRVTDLIWSIYSEMLSRGSSQWTMKRNKQNDVYNQFQIERINDVLDMFIINYFLNV